MFSLQTTHNRILEIDCTLFLSNRRKALPTFNAKLKQNCKTNYSQRMLPNSFPEFFKYVSVSLLWIVIFQWNTLSLFARPETFALEKTADGPGPSVPQKVICSLRSIWTYTFIHSSNENRLCSNLEKFIALFSTDRQHF